MPQNGPKRIYVVNRFSNNVSVIDGTTNTVIATVPVGTEPRFARVNQATNCIYVTNFSSNNVSVIDGKNNTVIATVPLGVRPVDVEILELNKSERFTISNRYNQKTKTWFSNI